VGSLVAGLGFGLAASVGLVDGLAGDAQRGPDLGPGGSLAACGGGQEISCVGKCVLGVSHRFEGFQGPLRAAPDPLEVFDHPAQLPARLAAFLGGHVNRCCTKTPTPITPDSPISIDVSICDTTFPNSFPVRVGSEADPFSAVRYRPTTEKKRPRAVAAAGVMTTEHEGFW